MAEALTEKLSERERKLMRACQAANEDPEVRAIEKEFEAMTEEGGESGTNAPTRRRVVGAARSHARRRN